MLNWRGAEAGELMQITNNMQSDCHPVGRGRGRRVQRIRMRPSFGGRKDGRGKPGGRSNTRHTPNLGILEKRSWPLLLRLA